ncbi:unnamed protein product [Litomosoides sigmodontis]|uniref:BPTI/Kunitz inhibitor domain-containing protein n=1 Tax=Litomosoides sigmodontis TaxID=42156 RepID=A0A3P6VEY4_LITSI|nr:unnamed protein product [Litomosoides sigmodontis]
MKNFASQQQQKKSITYFIRYWIIEQINILQVLLQALLLAHYEIELFRVLLQVLVNISGSQEVLENARCNQNPSRGTCEDRGFTIKWYYDRYAHRCRKFYYGGCGGNENHFDSFEECSQACSYRPTDESSKRCALPHDPGTCAGNFERWHFDARMRRCICSWWSGCGGNSNMFYSYTHCMSICGVYADNRTSASKMTFRQFTPKRKTSQVHHHRLRPVSVEENQQRGGQLAEEAKEKNNTHMIARIRGYVPGQREETIHEERQRSSDRMNEPKRDSERNSTVASQQRHMSSSFQTSSSNAMQASEVPATQRNAANIKAELSKSTVNQLSSKKNWYRNRVQSRTEGIPFEMIIRRADRIPDRYNTYVSETISTISSPIKDSDQQRQIVTIENDDDENYTYDQDDQNFSLPEYTPAQFKKGRWTVTIAVRPTSSSLISHSTDASTVETAGNVRESEVENDMIVIMPAINDN